MKFRKIVIIGSGAIGTAIGNTVANNSQVEVIILSIEDDVIESINNNHINKKYFPNIPLNERLVATAGLNVLNSADLVFLGIPSSALLDYLRKVKAVLNPRAPLVNLAKGFGSQHKTIAQCISEEFENPPCSLKGPTFAREMLEKSPTAFTFAAEDEQHFREFEKIFKGSPVALDFTTDVLGVELTSILKNIYAIVIGIIDARFNSPNLRFLMLTRAFKELREILNQFGGKDETLFKYCGFGDFTLTALNDLSRNRTLGLFMGKGFYTKEISDKVLLEGKIATKIFCEEIARRNNLHNHFIINELYKVFYEGVDITTFINKVVNI
ncbi:MAG: hypothetical protein K9G67_04670 [Bacteroidales bacterium]|nr:hypothetical protein [Bacteroidales bacterium]MCF8344429.1 hypothetical protein [Bacteroidales bacterium]MCF8351450.1 hypothetical protein [Bacteroidales bacterium]MCF8375626.1 hypothetical protein [Bacteroidales bacterium]MCF8400791.1 hypothetical protein [Bacteroidales bacterium]